MPLSVNVCGLFEASSVIVTEPVRLKGAVGAKVTLIVHGSPAPSEVPQVSVSAKSPLAEMPEMFSGVFRSLVKVVTCAALVLPTARLAKLRLACDKEATGMIFTTKASEEPPKAGWNALEVNGKSTE